MGKQGTEYEYASLHRARTTAVPPRRSVAALRVRLEELRFDMILEEAEREIAANRRRLERVLAMPAAPRPTPSSESAPPSPWLTIIDGCGEIVGSGGS